METEAIPVQTETAIEPVRQELLAFVEKVKTIRVVDQESFDGASDLLNLYVKQQRKKIAERHDPLIKSAYDNWKLNIATKKQLDDPLDEAERILKEEKIKPWLCARQKERDDEDRRRAEAAQKEADERKLAEAAALEVQGADKAAVDAVLEKPVTVERITPAPPTFQKRSDIGLTTVYSAEVKNFAALVKAAAKTPFLLGYLLPNQSALNKAATSMKETMNIPGVELKKDTNVRGKAR
jgi:hypothetical protein